MLQNQLKSRCPHLCQDLVSAQVFRLDLGKIMTFHLKQKPRLFSPLHHLIRTVMQIPMASFSARWAQLALHDYIQDLTIIQGGSLILSSCNMRLLHNWISSGLILWVLRTLCRTFTDRDPVPECKIFYIQRSQLAQAQPEVVCLYSAQWQNAWAWILSWWTHGSRGIWQGSLEGESFGGRAAEYYNIKAISLAQM